MRGGELSANIRREMTEEKDPEAPRDVLAAEEFGVPAPDPLLQHEPLNVPEDPEDPEGQEPPHDVLAGEEFPIPAAPARGGGGEPPDGAGTAARSRATAGAIGAVLVGIAAALRRRRGGKST